MFTHTDEYELYVALLWGELLGRDDVEPHEDFFALGGTIEDAAAMLETVRAEFGAAIPPVEFERNPTAAGLAQIVRQHLQKRGARPTPMRMPPWSDAQPPFVFVHGPAGELLSLQNFRPSQMGRPVMGLRGPGVDLEEDPLTSVDALVDRHVRDLTAAGIEEPIALVGSCMGGLVAFVLAQKLEAQGCKIAYLGLIEPPPADGNAVMETVEELVDEQLRYLCIMADLEVPRQVTLRECFRALQNADRLPRGYSLDLFERKMEVYLSIVRACYAYRVEGRYGGYTVLYESRESQGAQNPIGYLRDASEDWPYERFWREHLPLNTLVRRQKCAHIGLFRREQTRRLVIEDVQRALQ
ncbi:MAG: hypothetical protein AUG48_03440 [Actinobacteria bacterium 13_1_20CM_3_68_9]|nr:MAG: hypothetical protein AUG48_03440 [Actinobacteria bacterium 13_1_20CM_3_68_9]